MKTFFFLLVLAMANTSPAQAQNTQLVIDQAAVLPSIATSGSGTIWDIHEVTDAQGNTYQAVSFSGTVHFGSQTFTSSGAVGVSDDYDVAVAKRNATGGYQWAVAGGGVGSQRAVALAVDAAGNVFVTGSFDSPTATFGATAPLTNHRPATRNTRDVFVAKAGVRGAWEWAASAGGGDFISGDDYGTAVAVDALGGVYVAGILTSTVAFFGAIQVPSPDPFGGDIVFVAKLGSTGTWQWARTGTAPGNTPTHLVAEPGGTTYLSGEAGGYLSYGPFLLLNPGGRQVQFVAKLDPAGTWLWLTKSAGSRRNAGSSTHLGFAWDGQDRAYLTGHFNCDSLSFGNTHLVNSGSFQQVRSTEAFVAKLNTRNGRWVWAVQTRGQDNEVLVSALLDGAGRLLVGGQFRGTGSAGATALVSAGGYDLFVAQMDTATGAWQWARRAGGPGDENAHPRFVNGQGRVVIAGTFDGPTLPLSSGTLPAAPTVFAYGNTTYTRSAFEAVLGANGPLATPQARRAPEWTVYPNPTRTAVTVAGLLPSQPVQIFDLLGRLVFRCTVPAQGDLQLALLATLPPGLYLMRAGAQTRRLVVE